MESVQAKKVAAAVAAVLQYAAESEAVEVLPAAAAGVIHETPRSAAVWGLAGRQDLMLFRALCQRRLAKSW
jgi:hypothetical protein